MTPIVRRTLALAGAALSFVSTACLDDRPVSPNVTNPTVGLSFKATILQAAAGQTVQIRAFYGRADGTEITLESSPTSVSVSPGVPKLVGVVVHIAACLADTQRANANSNTCAVGVALTLEDEGGTPIDEQTTPPTPPLPPGGTATIGPPITFSPVAQVSVGTIPVLREGDTRTFTASAKDAQGNALTSRTFKWSSTNPNVLKVNAQTGAATAVAAGSAGVTVVTGVKSTTTTVRVIRKVTSIVLTPDPAPVVRAATTLSLVAAPKAAGGVDAGDLADRTVSWSVANPSGTTAIATVSPNGVVAGLYPGDADVSVTVDGVTKTTRVRVNAAGLTVASNTTLIVVGTKAPLQATVLDANDAPLPNVPVVWSSSDTLVAKVDAFGVVTAVGQGLAVIRATGGGVSGTSPMHVTSLALDVQPATDTVLAGNTVQLSAAQAAGTVQWESANSSIATVSSNGLVTARFPGTTSIFATAFSSLGAQRGTATIVVTAATLAITPTPSSMNTGDTLRFVATARDSKGVILDVPITWSSSNPQLAPVDSGGLVYAAAPTVASIKAAGGGLQASSTLTITDALGSVVAPRRRTERETAPTSATKRAPRN